MLELRPFCEHCGKNLPTDSQEAYICTFECTFCRDCMEGILEGVCPNCGGDFVRRPIRPKSLLVKYPPASNSIIKPVDIQKHKLRLNKLKYIKPADR